MAIILIKHFMQYIKCNILLLWIKINNKKPPDIIYNNTNNYIAIITFALKLKIPRYKYSNKIYYAVCI